MGSLESWIKSYKFFKILENLKKPCKFCEQISWNSQHFSKFVKLFIENFLQHVKIDKRYTWMRNQEWNFGKLFKYSPKSQKFVKSSE